MNQNQTLAPALYGREVQCGAVSYHLYGMAHTEADAVDRLRQQLNDGNFDAVAVELCPARHGALLQPEAWGQTDLFRILREGRAGMLAATLALSGWQQRLAEQSGVEPGAELRAVIETALQQGLPVLLLDRDLGITLKRLSQALPRGQRLQLFGGLLEGILSSEAIKPETLQSLREGDLLETALAPYVGSSERLREVLIDERDRYMAARLCEESATGDYRRVMVLAGEGHHEGLSRQLQSEEPCRQSAEVVEQLERSAPRSRRWRYLPWLVVAVILAGFAFGFSRGADLGGMMVLDWILINGVLSGLGAAIAGAHPLTIAAAFVAAPWTSLNPMIGASMVAGGVEVYLRKPRVSDFDTLRHDLTRLSGWWRNRVSRTLMVFFLAGMGSSIGTYVAGFRIYDRLMGA
ncbi:MAG TPA: TraB/GumN family protein [Gammaproteobacteria bacterium]